MHVLSRLLIVLLVTSIGSAREWRPFVEFGGGGEIVCPLSRLDLPNNGSGLFPSFAYGATIHAGVVNDDWSVYAGYHFQDALTVRYEESWYPYVNGYYSRSYDYNWKVSWVEFGGRWIPQTKPARKITPLIGGALVISDTRLIEYTTDQYLPYGGEIQNYHSTKSLRRSTTDLGFLLEFGFRVYVSKNLSLDVLSRLHRYEAEFRPSPEEPYLDHFVTLIPAFEIGMNWQLPLVIGH